MAQCVQIDPVTQVLTASSQTEVACSDYLLSTAADYHQMFAGITNATLETLGIDAATILYQAVDFISFASRIDPLRQKRERLVSYYF
jgi:hypothetical protein